MDVIKFMLDNNIAIFVEIDVIFLFYDKHLDDKEKYFYAKELSIKINAIY